MSWYEVEAKFRVDEPDTMREKLAQLGEREKIKEKKDIYYYLPPQKMPPHKKLRVRDNAEHYEVNFKVTDSDVNAVYAKKETEFTVSDKENFIDLIKHFGFEEYITKTKTTERFVTPDGVGLELNYLHELDSWFLEIEILTQKEHIKQARKRIVELRKALGLTAQDTETRGYTREMWEKTHPTTKTKNVLKKRTKHPAQGTLPTKRSRAKSSRKKTTTKKKR